MGSKSKKQKAKNSSARLKPKKECCVSKTRCQRCPIRLMKAGELPAGYTVKKRKLVKVKAAKSDKDMKPAKAA